jgi:hypothetical protein
MTRRKSNASFRPDFVPPDTLGFWLPYQLPFLSDDDLIWLAQAAYFWSQIDRSGGPDACWPWRGRADSDGYGQVFRFRKAHRVAYELAVGPIPDGHGVLHRCDNPPCCNPKDLFTGTQAVNSADMIAKGRARFGGRLILPSGPATPEGG